MTDPMATSTNVLSNLTAFNVRVYGVLLDSKQRVLVTDEFIRGMYITKFPGGGLEFGEGTRDCLQREFTEETGLNVTIGDHLYTTDFFQVSAFDHRYQIISIYYHVHINEPFELATKTELFDFTPHQVSDPNGECEVFRWIPVNELDETSVSLPIDKVVVGLVKGRVK